VSVLALYGPLPEAETGQIRVFWTLKTLRYLPMLIWMKLGHKWRPLEAAKLQEAEKRPKIPRFISVFGL